MNEKKLFRDGQMIDSNNRRWALDYYVYQVNAESLVPGGQQTDIISIEADADFILTKMTYMADVAGAAQTALSRVVPLVRVAISDTGSGRNLQNAPVDITQIAGDGGNPFTLPIPRQFKSKSSVNFTFSNYSAGTTYTNVSLCLIGYKKLPQ